MTARPTFRELTLEQKLRFLLNAWQTWQGAAWIVLGLVVVALYHQNGRILEASTKANRAETIRIVEARATYTQCVGSIPVLRKVNLFVVGVQDLGSVLLQNAVAAHAVQPRGPLYDAQSANLRRLRLSVHLISSIKGFPVQTKAECGSELAKALGP